MIKIFDWKSLPLENSDSDCWRWEEPELIFVQLRFLCRFGKGELPIDTSSFELHTMKAATWRQMAAGSSCCAAGARGFNCAPSLELICIAPLLSLLNHFRPSVSASKGFGVVLARSGCSSLINWQTQQVGMKKVSTSSRPLWSSKANNFFFEYFCALLVGEGKFIVRFNVI